ncbi:MAG: winged helix DNA-binding protein [Candidatus Kapabacteria bacterium]|nr:winged helix DNA-binding protein [Ignavibacteriota bacterium]MCW5885637.1 winged helix DNA-binding protein [Candidatus Kapabacteria bacterium]
MKLEDEIKQSKFHSEYHKLVINLLFTSKWIEQKNAEVLKPYNISGQQFNILRILRGQHPNCASMTMLQERMLDRMSNASRLVEKLRIKGLVERKENDEDRRQVRVTITDKGLEMLGELDNIMNVRQKDFENITSEEALLLNDLLDRFRC